MKTMKLVLNGAELNTGAEIQNKAVVDLIYPVGSIYIAVGGVDPNNQFSGTTWERLADGKFLENTTDTNQEGNSVEAGLPNIKGSQPIGDSKALIAHPNLAQNSSTLIGIQSTGYANAIQYTSQTVGSRWVFLDFDASRANAIYGKSNTVQPSSVKCAMWKRVK